MANTVLHYDAIVIGSGQGGTPLAVEMAARGEKVALIESGWLGGTCVNTGCTPTKAMISSAQVAYYARNAGHWGVRAGEVSVDLPAVRHRKDEIVHDFRGGWEKKMDGDKKPDWHRGRARFTGPKQIEVTGKTLEAPRIFIDTGTSTAIPPVPGLDSINYLTNATIMELDTVPKHLLVLGGSYIGLEFGQMFRRFGSKVTVLESSGHILPKEDEDVAAEIQKALEEEGIEFHLKTRATAISKHSEGLELSVEGGDQLVGSHLLLAAGRKPNTKELDLDRTGVNTNEKGYVQVNDRLETNVEGIWAIGDVNGGPAFTHISYNDYQIIWANLYEGKQCSTKTRLVPYAVFTDPQLGRVGMTETEARKSGKRIKVGKAEMSGVARARERGETHGLMKVVVNAENDRLLGAAILNSEGGELVQILSTLMLAEQPYTLLNGAIYIHPTLAEGFFRLMNSVEEVN